MARGWRTEGRVLTALELFCLSTAHLQERALRDSPVQIRGTSANCQTISQSHQDTPSWEALLDISPKETKEQDRVAQSQGRADLPGD